MWIRDRASLLRKVGASEVGVTVAEAFVKLALFMGYMLLISRMKDIQRTFMYHGAEHKCINCVEHGLPLTVENVLASSRQHKRCGTSFLFLVMIVSIFLHFIFVLVPGYCCLLYTSPDSSGPDNFYPDMFFSHSPHKMFCFLLLYFPVCPVPPAGFQFFSFLPLQDVYKRQLILRAAPKNRFGM